MGLRFDFFVRLLEYPAKVGLRVTAGSRGCHDTGSKDIEDNSSLFRVSEFAGCEENSLTPQKSLRSIIARGQAMVRKVGCECLAMLYYIFASLVKVAFPGPKKVTFIVGSRFRFGVDYAIRKRDNLIPEWLSQSLPIVEYPCRKSAVFADLLFCSRQERKKLEHSIAKPVVIFAVSRVMLEEHLQLRGPADVGDVLEGNEVGQNKRAPALIA